MSLEAEELRNALRRLWKSHPVVNPRATTTIELRADVFLSWDGSQLTLRVPDSYRSPPWCCEQISSSAPGSVYRLAVGSPDFV